VSRAVRFVLTDLEVMQIFEVWRERIRPQPSIRVAGLLIFHSLDLDVVVQPHPLRRRKQSFSFL